MVIAVPVNGSENNNNCNNPSRMLCLPAIAKQIGSPGDIISIIVLITTVRAGLDLIWIINSPAGRPRRINYPPPATGKAPRQSVAAHSTQAAPFVGRAPRSRREAAGRLRNVAHNSISADPREPVVGRQVAPGAPHFRPPLPPPPPQASMSYWLRGGTLCDRGLHFRFSRLSQLTSAATAGKKHQEAAAPRNT